MHALLCRMRARFVFLLAALQIGCTTGHARIGDKAEAPSVTARTRNGAILMGHAGFDELEFVTAVGRVTVPAARLARISISLPDQEPAAIVEFRNGDRLSGTLAQKSLSIRSPYGPQEVPVHDLESITFEIPAPTLNAGSVSAGLVRYHPFDLDPDLDRSPAAPGHVLALPGDRPLHSASGRVGGALACDGRSSYFTGGTQPLVSTSALTLAVWIRPERPQFSPTIQFASTCEKYGPHVWITEEGGVYVNLWGRLGNDRVLRTPGNLVRAREWTHLAVTYDGNRCLIYVNGGLVAERDFGPLNLECQHPLLVGAFLCSDGRRFVFDGLIDEVRIYNRALAAGEVLAIRDFRGTAGGMSTTDAERPTPVRTEKPRPRKQEP